MIGMCLLGEDSVKSYGSVLKRQIPLNAAVHRIPFLLDQKLVFEIGTVNACGSRGFQALGVKMLEAVLFIQFPLGRHVSH